MADNKALGPLLRQAFRDGLEEKCRREMKTRAEIMADLMVEKKDFISLLNAIAKFEAKTEEENKKDLVDALEEFDARRREYEKSQGVYPAGPGRAN